MLESLGSNVEEMRGRLNFAADKLTMRDNALKAMMMVLKEETIAKTRALNTKIE